MFGTITYAQSPFAAAQGNAFFAVVEDAAAASDSVSSLPTYSAQILETASSPDRLMSDFVLGLALAVGFVLTALLVAHFIVWYFYG